MSVPFFENSQHLIKFLPLCLSQSPNPTSVLLPALLIPAIIPEQFKTRTISCTQSLHTLIVHPILEIMLSATQLIAIFASAISLLPSTLAVEHPHQDLLQSPAWDFPKKAICRTDTPTSYGYILFPGFQAIDVFGPLDALNTLSWSHNITLSLIAKTLDPVSTQWRAPTIVSTFGESILPTTTFATAPPLDVLIVPGGLGTRAPDLDQEIAFIKASYPKLHSLITVCTGAGLAARAGVLDGKRATTNKNAWNETTALGPRVKWVTHARWVTDGNIWSSSGVTAGIDVLFAWMEAIYGNDTATEVANGLEYERHLNSSWDPFADLNHLPPN